MINIIFKMLYINLNLVRQNRFISLNEIKGLMRFYTETDDDLSNYTTYKCTYLTRSLHT